jgi:FtsZ-binding cell division protein ZapB
LQKEKRKICELTASKRKACEKLEKLNQAKEQIEAIQREKDEMKEQENSLMWQQSPLQNSGPKSRTPKEIFSREMESHNSWILNHHYP